ncbi:hypothetical protein L1887_53379 [Cichorium endivia]|nr:hypothetical protein L1887_53379 [Cichorium endivia]
MTSPYVVEVLAAVREASDRVLEHIRDDMQRKHGVTWSIERAFHAVPSMEHLHLHVTSMDLLSDRLKHKKHYLSFVPTVDFAQRLDDVDKMVAEGRQALPKSERAYENLLKGPLASHHTGQRFKFFPELKAHLESHWRDTVLAQGETGPETHAESTASKRAASIGAEEHSTSRRKVESHQPESTSGPNATESDTDEEPALPLRSTGHRSRDLDCRHRPSGSFGRTLDRREAEYRRMIPSTRQHSLQPHPTGSSTTACKTPSHWPAWKRLLSLSWYHRALNYWPDEAKA